MNPSFLSAFQHLGRPLRHSAGFVIALAIALGSAVPAHAAEDFSPAERAIFMTNQLASLKPGQSLSYNVSKSGSLEDGFSDKVRVDIKANPAGGCCLVGTEFLSGARKLALPEVETADGNPVILYFLERDIREMERLTKGKANYFRKRIRMAVYQGAQFKDLNLPYQGRSISARQITIEPYVDDPMRARFERFAKKQYVFTLADAVPGGVVAISTRMAGDVVGAPPLIVEEMVLDGIALPARNNP